MKGIFLASLIHSHFRPVGPGPSLGIAAHIQSDPDTLGTGFQSQIPTQHLFVS